MHDILKRFSQLDVDNDLPKLDAEGSNLGFLGELTAEEVENMTPEELMAYIGPEALHRFEEDLKTNPKFIEEALKLWKPWWLRPSVSVAENVSTKECSTNHEKIPEALEELPPLSELASERPPETLWNNLVELLYLYVYLTRTYSKERMSLATDYVKDFCTFSRVLASRRFTHSSVIHALRSVEAAISLESESFISDETKVLILEDLQVIFGRNVYIVAALGDLQRIFETSVQNARSYFLAAKKIYFYNVWISDEIRTDGDLIETIAASIRSLISGYSENLSESRGSDMKDKPSPLQILRNLN